jgi:hypothetical protein
MVIEAIVIDIVTCWVTNIDPVSKVGGCSSYYRHFSLHVIKIMHALGYNCCNLLLLYYHFCDNTCHQICASGSHCAYLKGTPEQCLALKVRNLLIYTIRMPLS